MSTSTTYKLFPSNRQNAPKIVPLSVLEVTAPPAPFACMWFFEDVDAKKLEETIQPTIDKFVPWTGSMRFVEKVEFNSGSPLTRPGHMELEYNNSETDQGVQVTISEMDKTIAELMKSIETDDPTVRKSLDPTPFVDAFPMPPFENGSILKLKITKLAGDAVAVGMSIPHVLADAPSGLSFMRCWAAAYNGEFNFEAPEYNPRTIDSLAIPFSPKDPESLAFGEKSLPLFDYYASTEKIHPTLKPLANPNPDLIKLVPLGKPMPYHTIHLDNEILIFEFTAQEIENIHKYVQDPSVSRIDAFSMHIWNCVVKAQEVPPENDVHCYIPINLRYRYKGNKDFDNKIGCMVAVSDLVEKAGNVELVQDAKHARQCINGTNSKTIPQLMHWLGSTISPMRYALYTIDDHSTVVTSWCDMGVYELQFGKTIHFEMVFFAVLDGLVQIADYAAPAGTATKSKWYENGASVAVMLNKPAMARFTKLQDLRKFR